MAPNHDSEQGCAIPVLLIAMAVESISSAVTRRR